jgi:2-polyprenyl-3-methyl-5-hydroxy-6-metoxy-1,4-benzoquinol methylase
MNKLKYIKRELDVITNKKDLIHIFSILKFPVYMGITNQDPCEDIFEEMSFSISKLSGCVQLDKLIPLDILYSENHNSVVGQLWRDHHFSFAKFINTFNPKNVLEIGGAHGMLCKNIEELNPQTQWTIVEPNPIPVKNLKAKYINGFFDSTIKTNQKYDMIVHSHTLEHIYDPNKFIYNISQFLSEGDFHCFSVPNIDVWLDRKYTNALNFEHSYLLNDFYIETLLKNNAFEIINKRIFSDNHSTFYATKKILKNDKLNIKFPKSLYSKNLNLINDYYKYLVSDVNELNNLISKYDKNIYIFGAHVFSQTLLALGLNSTKIECVIDNSESKQGKRLYGTNLLVNSPKILKYSSNPVIIIRSGSYQDEIIAEIRKLYNNNAIFI